jgi:hypothetical protein
MLDLIHEGSRTRRTIHVNKTGLFFARAVLTQKGLLEYDTTYSFS